MLLANSEELVAFRQNLVAHDMMLIH